MVRIKFNRKRQSTTYCGRICILLKRLVTNYNFLNNGESAKFQENNYDNSFRVLQRFFSNCFQTVCGKLTLWGLDICEKLRCTI